MTWRQPLLTGLSRSVPPTWDKVDIEPFHCFTSWWSSTVREQIVDEECLHTVLHEAEWIINNRLIREVSSDLEALIPKHLLLLKTKPSLAPGLFDQDNLYSWCGLKQVQYMSNLFWKAWTKVPTATPGTSVVGHSIKKRCRRRCHSSCAPRNSWIMGKITEAVPDKRGLVCRVLLWYVNSFLWQSYDMLPGIMKQA